MKIRIIFCFSVVFALISFSSRANVRLPYFFSSNMVLQRDIPVKIWGMAEKYEHVTVSFD